MTSNAPKIFSVSNRPIAVLAIRDSRHPWVICVLIGCVISGLVGVLRPPNNRVPIDQLVPDPYRVWYYSLLAVAGFLTLIGIWLPRLRDRLMAELVGMWFISAPLLIYPMAITFVLGVPIGIGGILSSTFGFGGLIRVIGIFLELRTLRRTKETS